MIKRSSKMNLRVRSRNSPAKGRPKNRKKWESWRAGWPQAQKGPQ